MCAKFKSFISLETLGTLEYLLNYYYLSPNLLDTIPSQCNEQRCGGLTKPPNGAIVTCPRRDTTLRLVQALLLARSKVQGATRIVEWSPKVAIASKSEGACTIPNSVALSERNIIIPSMGKMK